MEFGQNNENFWPKIQFDQLCELTKTMPTIENFGQKITFAQLCFRPKQRQPFKNFWPKKFN